MMGPFRCIADLRGTLLESPVWDDRRGVIFLCDIPAGRIHEIGLDDGPRRQWSFKSEVTALGLCDSGRLVVALARAVELFDPDTGTRSPLWSGFDEPASSRLNDGKVGPDGAFWVGSMDGRAVRQPISRLYRIPASGAAQVMAEGFEISNGLAWSADGRSMFHSDSRGPWIDRYTFDPAKGTLSARHRLHDLDEATGRPDGGATDAEGGYWSAGVSAGVLNRFAPDGALTDRVPLPVPSPTMPCFCGPDLRQIAVTSHRLAADTAQSGGLFLADSPVAGAAVSRMKGL